MLAKELMLKVSVERCNGQVRVEEYPRTEKEAINKYYEWIKHYYKVGGFTMISIELPTLKRSTRIAGKIVSVIREGALC